MKNNPKDSVLKSILRYSSSQIYMRIAGLFSAFVKPMFLTPEIFGLWNILNIIPTYSNYIQFGAFDIMRYRIPYHESRKESHKSREILDSAFWGSLYLRMVIVVALIFFFIWGDFNLAARVGLLTMVLVVALEWYFNYYVDFLKAYQNFRVISNANYLRATVASISSVVLIFLFGIYGLYLSVLLTLLAAIGYLRSTYPLAPHGNFKFPVFKNLVKAGFPIMGFGILSELIFSVDRIIVSYFLGNEQLGYYGIAAMVFGFLMQIPGTAREVTEPILMREMAENPREKTLNEHLLKPLINTAYFMPFLIGPVFFIFPLVIPLLLPRYIQGIAPTQIVVLGGYFLSLAYATRGIIIANNWQIKASIIMACAFLVNIGLSILLIKLGFGIEGVALGSSASYFLLFLSFLVFIRRKCNYALEDWKTNLIGMCFPFPVTCLVIVALRRISESMALNAYVAGFVGLFVFYLSTIFVLNRARDRFALLKGIRWQGFGRRGQ